MSKWESKQKIKREREKERMKKSDNFDRYNIDRWNFRFKCKMKKDGEAFRRE